MTTAPLSFAKPIFCLIVLPRHRIEPSRCSRTDRPPHSYKIRIGKVHDAPTKFPDVESWGRHGRFYCGDSESESARSGPIESTASFPKKPTSLTYRRMEGHFMRMFNPSLTYSVKTAASSPVGNLERESCGKLQHARKAVWADFL